MIDEHGPDGRQRAKNRSGKSQSFTTHDSRFTKSRNGSGSGNSTFDVRRSTFDVRDGWMMVFWSRDPGRIAGLCDIFLSANNKSNNRNNTCITVQYGMLSIRLHALSQICLFLEEVSASAFRGSAVRFARGCGTSPYSILRSDLDGPEYTWKTSKCR